VVLQSLYQSAMTAVIIALAACGHGGGAPEGSWAMMYGPGVRAYDVKPTVDGGAIIAGVIRGVPDRTDDAWVAKLDLYGNIEWQQSYGGPSSDIAYIVHPTTDGGYVVAGDTADGSGWLLKLDANGNVKWQRAYGPGGDDGFHVRGMQFTADGGYVLVGSYQIPGVALSQVWVMKVDVTGAIVWQRIYGGAYNHLGNAIATLSDGGYLVAAVAQPFGAPWDPWMLKLDANGSIQWQRTYGTSRLANTGNMAWAIQGSGDGGAVFVGSAFSSEVGQLSDVWAVKIDAIGNVSWSSSLGGTQSDNGSAVVATADGGYVVAGQLGSDAWVVKLDAGGAVVWETTYRSLASGAYKANAVRQMYDGGYVIAGSGLDDAFIVKLDVNGRVAGCDKTTTSRAMVLHPTPVVTNSTFAPLSVGAVPMASALTGLPATVSASRTC